MWFEPPPTQSRPLNLEAILSNFPSLVLHNKCKICDRFTCIYRKKDSSGMVFLYYFHIYWFLLAMWCQCRVRPKGPQGMNGFRMKKWHPLLWSISVSKLYFWQKNATMIKTFLKNKSSTYKYKKYQNIYGLLCFSLFCIQLAFSFPFFSYFELPFAIKPFGYFWCVAWFFLFHIQLASFLIFHFLYFSLHTS